MGTIRTTARAKCPTSVRTLDRDALSTKILAAWKTLLGEDYEAYSSNQVGELLRRTLDAIEADARAEGMP